MVYVISSHGTTVGQTLLWPRGHWFLCTNKAFPCGRILSAPPSWPRGLVVVTEVKGQSMADSVGAVTWSRDVGSL